MKIMKKKYDKKLLIQFNMQKNIQYVLEKNMFDISMLSAHQIV